jgi:hypothetical protein
MINEMLWKLYQSYNLLGGGFLGVFFVEARLVISPRIDQFQLVNKSSQIAVFSFAFELEPGLRYGT